MAETPQNRRNASASADRRSEARFPRKVTASRWAVWFESVLPRFWGLIGVFAAFLLVTLAGLWTAGGAITPAAVKANPKVLDFYRRHGAA